MSETTPHLLDQHLFTPKIRGIVVVYDEINIFHAFSYIVIIEIEMTFMVDSRDCRLKLQSTGINFKEV